MKHTTETVTCDLCRDLIIPEAGRYQARYSVPYIDQDTGRPVPGMVSEHVEKDLCEQCATVTGLKAVIEWIAGANVATFYRPEKS